MEHKQEKQEYFRLPGTTYFVFSTLGMILTSLAYLSPQLVPYDHLGPLGTLTSYLVTDLPLVLAGIFYMAWTLHIGEGVYALKLARQKNLTERAARLWALWTFICGIGSLRHLLAYKPQN